MSAEPRFQNVVNRRAPQLGVYVSFMFIFIGEKHARHPGVPLHFEQYRPERRNGDHQSGSGCIEINKFINFWPICKDFVPSFADRSAHVRHHDTMMV